VADRIDPLVVEASRTAEGAVKNPRRLAAVQSSGLPHGEQSEVLDRLTALARKLLDVPATFVSIVDSGCDVYLSHDGLPEPLATTRRLEGLTFCHLAISSPGPLVIPDTRAHPVYRQIPTVESLGVAAYLGIPIRLPSGDVLGSFCAVDVEPHEWSGTDVEVLVELAHSAEREISLRSQLARAESEALTDPLTQLPNKRAFHETLTHLAAAAARDGSDLAAILFDLDQFKSINDTFGHAAGDRVLADVGALIPQILRSSDFAARFGGEEFVALLPGVSGNEAVLVAEKLRSSVEAAVISPVEHVTASFGTAVFPHDAGGPAGLLRAADLALYAAKERGRNCVASAAALT
jgi:diguanylate cyclase (GGDEF)-like protein